MLPLQEEEEEEEEEEEVREAEEGATTSVAISLDRLPEELRPKPGK